MTPIISAAVLLIALALGGYLGYAFGKYNGRYLECQNSP